MQTVSKNVIRYGSDAPLPTPKTLVAGPLRVQFEEGALRYVYCGEHEIVRGIYSAIRDRDWNTVPGQLSDVAIRESDEGFSVHFVSDHHQGDIHFTWAGTIEGRSDGTLTFDMDGTAQSTFLRNRIGFCILHPMEMAGLPVVVKTTDGDVSGEFPKPIAPHQPFFQMTGMNYAPGDSVSVEMTFEGDIFEMEDQRNWTDASYKTYCTPLGLPFPVEVQKGQRIHQRITVKAQYNGVSGQDMNHNSNVPRITVGSTPVKPVPKIGFSYSGPIPSETVLERLKALRPSHLRVTMDLTNADWKPRLAYAIEQAKEIGAALHGEVIVTDGDKQLPELMQYFSAQEHTMTHLFVFDAKTHVANAELLKTARGLANSHNVSIQIGGGTRAFFTEFNRASLPLKDMDCAGYTINPQVHAFDNQSLMETVAVQPETVKTARQIVGHDMDLVVGPITFKMHVNPNATSDSPIPFEDTVEARQQSLFGAAWTVGSLAHVTTADVDAITYFETLGPRGLMDSDGNVFPLYHVFREIAEGKEILPVSGKHANGIGVFAFRAESGTRILVANKTSEELCAELELPVGEATVRYLDESSFLDATENPVQFRASGGAVPVESGMLRLHLNPYSVAVVNM